MKTLTFFMGILVFAVVRLVLTGVLSIWGGVTLEEHFFDQLLLGLLSGIVVIPLVMLVKKRWMQLIVGSVVTALFADSLFLYYAAHGNMPTPLLIGSLLMVTFGWMICGFLSVWLTGLVVEYYVRSRRFRQTVDSKRGAF